LPPPGEQLLELLGAGEMASGEVVEAIGAEFGITQAAVSQHLKVLRESGFARVRADAQRRLYSVARTLVAFLDGLGSPCGWAAKRLLYIQSKS